MIPKIIHYCWLSGDPIPEKLQEYMKSWKENLSDYEFMLWDLNRFPLSSSVWVEEAFQARKYAFAADYIRLYALYHYGGIYMDMDVQVIKPFDDLLENDYLLGYESEVGIEAGIMGSTSHSDWLKDSLSHYENRHFIKPDGSFDDCPLPKILFDMLKEKYPDFFILPPDYLTTKSIETGKIHVTKNSYTIHHFAGSWCSKRWKVKRFIYLLFTKNKFIYSLYKKFYRNRYK